MKAHNASVMLFDSAPGFSEKVNFKKLLDINLSKQYESNSVMFEKVFLKIIIDTNGVAICPVFLTKNINNYSEVKQLILERLFKLKFSPAVLRNNKQFSEFTFYFNIFYK